MNKYNLIQELQDLKPLRVMDKYFLYNEVTAANSEVDSKIWTLVCKTRKRDSSAWESIKSNLKLYKLLNDNPGSGDGSHIPDPRNIILQISHACNLRCKYCSADFGRYGGQYRAMSLGMAKKAIDFLFDTTKSTHLAITYFGGEPLLNPNTVLHSARYSLDKAEKTGKEVSLHLVTNGVLLNSKTLQALDGLGFSLTVSLDGPPALQDVYRPFPDGKGSYEFVAASLRSIAKLPIWYRTTVRGTFTRRSAYFFPTVKFLAEKNFSRNIAYEPVFLPPRHPLALRWEDLPAIKRAYADLAKYYVARLKRRKPFCLWDFDDSVTQLILQRPRQSRCGAGVTTVAVTAEGNIYGCHMSTGMENAWIGNLDNGIVKDKKRPWESTYLLRRADCLNCWLRALCGGGCSAHAIYYNGDIFIPYRLECELIKHRYRLALWILSQVPTLRESALSFTETNKKRDSGHILVPLSDYPYAWSAN